MSDSSSGTTTTATSSSTATSNSTAAPSSTPPTHQPKNCAGPITGAAVGCLVAGLILGILGAFFFLRHRDKKGKHYRQPGQILSKELEHSPPVPDPPSNNVKLDYFLLDATPDKELVSELQALGDLVHTHVEDNYQFQTVQAHSSVVAQSVLNLGFPPASGDAVAGLCLNPQTRGIGLRHVISHIAFASIDFNARSSLSMLPLPMAAFLQSMPPVEPHSDNAVGTSLALSRWRALSAFLLHPARSERTPLAPSEAAAIPQVQRLASALNTVLYHFISPEPGRCEAQTEHLQGVIMEFAKFGYALLSQPGDWRFMYEPSTADMGQRAVVVCAGLEKLSHRDGRPYGSPQLVEAPRVVQVP